MTLSCEAWKPSTAAVFYTDATMAQQQSGTITTATSGSPVTPAKSNTLVMGYMTVASSSVTAGAGYTLIDTDTTFDFFPEYQLQSTATAANTPYSNPALAWNDGMAGYYFQ
jgi:hypothetical protein